MRVWADLRPARRWHPRPGGRHAHRSRCQRLSLRSRGHRAAVRDGGRVSDRGLPGGDDGGGAAPPGDRRGGAIGRGGPPNGPGRERGGPARPGDPGRGGRRALAHAAAVRAEGPPRRPSGGGWKITEYRVTMEITFILED